MAKEKRSGSTQGGESVNAAGARPRTSLCLWVGFGHGLATLLSHFLAAQSQELCQYPSGEPPPLVLSYWAAVEARERCLMGGGPLRRLQAVIVPL